MGYGFGIWLVVNNDYLRDYIIKNNSNPHQSHITIRCNMELNGATQLFEKIIKIKRIKKNLKVKNISDFVVFDNKKYSDADNLVGAGYYVKINNWNKFNNEMKKYKGTSSPRPHLSLIYRNDIDSLNEYYKNHKEYDLKIQNMCKTEYKICLVDIRSDNPLEWNILRICPI